MFVNLKQGSDAAMLSNEIAGIQNRQQKRAVEKKLKTKINSKAEWNNMVNFFNLMNKHRLIDQPKYKEWLLEGDKVRINVKKIMAKPDWDEYRTEYKKFVEENDGTVFTVGYDENKKDKPNIVCLQEDPRDPKFLWWEGDLLVKDTRDGKFKELYMITEGGGERR